MIVEDTSSDGGFNATAVTLARSLIVIPTQLDVGSD
jgi:hypothetical protein